ncbi:nuclear transcription factor Y subunit B-1-like [Impatiens glandulifera]|uniref:nuclear transcription factor Y subunit B-1-like n=1 Tax=Impatiens glandulifera TaxID=253017 RepID=UPI001FB18E53|nr:nuclear transcription factor Y subunit B-1-like [Impatiens glandulifera]
MGHLVFQAHDAVGPHGPLNVMNVERGSETILLAQVTLMLDLDFGTYVVPPTKPFIPVANVVRIMQRVVPTHVKIADDMKEIVQHCVSEFIGVITVEANMHCQSESRRTITADDIMWAMAKLGFDDYVNTLSIYMFRYREAKSMGMTVSMRPFMTFGPIPDTMGQFCRPTM